MSAAKSREMLKEILLRSANDLKPGGEGSLFQHDGNQKQRAKAMQGWPPDTSNEISNTIKCAKTYNNNYN